VGTAAVPVGETSLADQTVSFIQQLTESVQQVPGEVVVAPLPASEYEVAQSEKGPEAFVTLENRFQRLGAASNPSPIRRSTKSSGLVSSSRLMVCRLEAHPPTSGIPRRLPRSIKRCMRLTPGKYRPRPRRIPIAS
jgi:hypothetical protein